MNRSEIENLSDRYGDNKSNERTDGSEKRRAAYFINRSKIPGDKFPFFRIDQNAEVVVVADFTNNTRLLTQW